MLTLLGSVLGFGTSFLPKLLGYFETARDQKHELRLLEKQLESQERQGALRIEEVSIDADIREIEALHKEQTVITSKASQWVVNLNASVRPIITYGMFFEIIGLIGLLAFGYIDQAEFDQVWSPEFQGVWAAVVCFWFGQRTFNRK